LYTKTQLCEREYKCAEHAAFDRKREVGEDGCTNRSPLGDPETETEKERERAREWKREGNRITDVGSQFAVPAIPSSGIFFPATVAGQTLEKKEEQRAGKGRLGEEGGEGR